MVISSSMNIEAGRGCIAGEMYFCGVDVIGNVDFADDSKKTTVSQREKMYDKIVENVNYHIVVKNNTEIDDKGLSQCIKECLEEIIDYFPNRKYLYDGKAKFNCTEPNLEVLAKADALVKGVGAASILCKIIKDRSMKQHHKISD